MKKWKAAQSQIPGNAYDESVAETETDEDGGEGEGEAERERARRHAPRIPLAPIRLLPLVKHKIYSGRATLPPAPLINAHCLLTGLPVTSQAEMPIQIRFVGGRPRHTESCQDALLFKTPALFENGVSETADRYFL